MHIADIKAGMPVYFCPGEAGERFGYVVRVATRGSRRVSVLYEKSAGHYTVAVTDPDRVSLANNRLTPARRRTILRRYIKRVRAKGTTTTKMAAMAAAVVLSEGLKLEGGE
jgi:hypothetical protein